MRMGIKGEKMESRSGCRTRGGSGSGGGSCGMSLEEST
jgi:hypothetical protein